MPPNCRGSPRLTPPPGHSDPRASVDQSAQGDPEDALSEFTNRISAKGAPRFPDDREWGSSRTPAYTDCSLRGCSNPPVIRRTAPAVERQTLTHCVRCGDPRNAFGSIRQDACRHDTDREVRFGRRTQRCALQRSSRDRHTVR